MFVELVALCVVSLLLWDYVNKKHRNDTLRKYNIPGPKTWPIIGNALELRGISPKNSIEFLHINKRKYGKVFYFWVLHQLNIVILDLKYLEVILSSQQTIKKGVLYKFLSVWLGDGLLLSSGRKWHSRRKTITPAFHFKILDQFVEIFDQQSSVMVQKLHKMADGTTAINIFPIVCLTALDIITETAMGVKINAKENSDVEYVKAVDYVTYAMGMRFTTPSQRTDWLFRLTAPQEYRKMREGIKVLHRFTNNVIEERRSVLEAAIADGTYQPMSENDGTGSKRRMALLDVLLQLTVDGAPLSNDDIREEVDTFMFEGHDTTTSGIAFCLYLIARHPEVQRKIVEELHAVIGRDASTAVTHRHLQELKYLDCVIKESLRLYPPVPVIARDLTEVLKIDDIVLPANTNLSLALFMVFRDPDYFSDPDDFKPERFFVEAADKVNPFAYVPFSAGPRNCIGQKFAMLEMKSTISKVLRHFELLPLGPPVEPMIYIILKSGTGIHLGLKPRK